MIDACTMQDVSKFESNQEISSKVLRGEYRLLRRKQRGSVWKVYREIVRTDGAIINGLYFCTGCKRVMRSFNTSNLRTHKCHVDYLRTEELCEDGIAEIHSPKLDDSLERRLSWNNFQPAEWSFHAVELLLELWAQHCVDLRDTRKRVKVIWKMTGEMKTLGFTFTEIKNKIDDMGQQYRRESHMEKTTGHKSEWEYYETLKMIFTSDRNIIDSMPLENSGNVPITTSEQNSFGSQLDEPLVSNYLQSQNVQTRERDGFDRNECAEDVQEDVDELRILKDNIIREIEESSTVHSQENYEDELDQQNSKTEEMRRSKRQRAARMMEIEEEKLVIEKKKCKLMKFFVREMSSFHKDFMDLLSNPKEGSHS
ncbi:uncharacterized protein LOC6544661 [Drosophila erecta]|uniref:BED-type domain-containing protein n=1 Tax=Drosophila erecta TaxID=7220 RepID=B3NH59_DROER|nr:uncharacterized protein LOC6544661 [Drosophila erecta]EDV51516.1 uncharacterized protein Dere_GG15557 [Drosophila erecta]